MQFRDLNRKRADAAPRGMNQNIFARLQLGAGHQHVPRGQRHQRQRRSFGPTQSFWLRNYIDAGYGNQFSVTTVASIPDDVVVVAHVVATAETLDAMTTRYARLNHHFVAGFDPGDQLAGFAYHARNIVAEDVR